MKIKELLTESDLYPTNIPLSQYRGAMDTQTPDSKDLTIGYIADLLEISENICQVGHTATKNLPMVVRCLLQQNNKIR